MKLAVVGAAGAFGQKHLEALAAIDPQLIGAVVGDNLEALAPVCQKFGVSTAYGSLEQMLADPAIDGVILATPTPLHASQAIACLQAGKHTMVEIPMADNLADAQALLAAAQASGKVAMAGHTRRFNPSHQWLHQRFQSGQLALQQLQVQTYFLRRSNLNALGQPRSWTDHLLWHHACHTVDLFAYQSRENISRSLALQGPPHPVMGIAMDMSISLQTPSGSLCSLSLSFNNDGPLGTFFRYICDHGTYLARYDELLDGHNRPIDLSGVAVSLNGIELQDREFINAITDQREPNASIAQCFGAMEVLDQIEKQLRGQ